LQREFEQLDDRLANALERPVTNEDGTKSVPNYNGLAQGEVPIVDRGDVEEVGYNGHLLRLAMDLLKLVKYSQALANYLEGNPRWVNFANNSLKKLVDLDTHQICGGPPPPPAMGMGFSELGSLMFGGGMGGSGDSNHSLMLLQQQIQQQQRRNMFENQGQGDSGEIEEEEISYQGFDSSGFGVDHDNGFGDQDANAAAAAFEHGFDDGYNQSFDQVNDDFSDDDDDDDEEEEEVEEVGEQRVEELKSQPSEEGHSTS